MPALPSGWRAVKGKNKNEEQRKALFSLQSNYDLDAVTGLSGFDRRQVCVPKVCEKTCRLRNSCRYHQYLKEARSAEIFVQICNHNYLLARCSPSASGTAAPSERLPGFGHRRSPQAAQMPPARCMGRACRRRIFMNSALCSQRRSISLRRRTCGKSSGR